MKKKRLLIKMSAMGMACIMLAASVKMPADAAATYSGCKEAGMTENCDTGSDLKCDDGCYSTNMWITVKNAYDATISVVIEDDFDSNTKWTNWPIGIAVNGANGTAGKPIHTIKHGSFTIEKSGNDQIVKLVNCDTRGVTPYIYIKGDARKGYHINLVDLDGDGKAKEEDVQVTKNNKNDKGNYVHGSHVCKNKISLGGHNVGYVDRRDGNCYAYIGALNTAIEYTINWIPNTYKVKYNGNGSTSGSMSDSEHTYDKAKKLSKNAFKREFTLTYDTNGGNSISATEVSSTFNGWAKTANGDKKYDDEASVKNLKTSGTQNLYAKWTDGSVTLPTPKRIGYTFDGWYTAATGGTKVDNDNNGSYTVSKTQTIYAHWTVNEGTVKYNANGGTAAVGYTLASDNTILKNSAPLTKTIKYTTKKVNLHDAGNLLTKPGYHIKSEAEAWTINSAGKALSQETDNEAAATELKTALGLGTTTGGVVSLWANWIPNDYYVSYNGNGANRGNVEKSQHIYDKESSLNENKYGMDCNIIYDTGAIGGNKTETKLVTDAYAFKEWKDASGKTYSNQQNVSKLTTQNMGTVTLYAQWIPSTITLNASIPTATGYDFDGWDDPDTSTIEHWKNGQTYTMPALTSGATAKDKKFVATWKEKEYTIYYDLNGGTGTPVSDTKKYFTDYTVKSDSECGYTREEYTFAGWATVPDFNPLGEIKEENGKNIIIPPNWEEEYQPGQVLNETLINDETIINGKRLGLGTEDKNLNRKLTLYAVWMPNLKIAYMMNNTATTAEANSEYTMSGENIIDDGENGIGIPMNEGCTIYDNMTEAVQTYALDTSEEVEENFKMEGVYTYQDNNGISYTENVTSTVVGWAFKDYEDADSCDYALAQEVEKTEDLYEQGKVLDKNSITNGTPRAEFYQNADGQVNPAVPQPESDNTIYANLFAVYDYGPKVHAVPLYYTLHNAQIGYITLDDLLSHVEVFDTEDSNIVAVDTIPAKEDRAEDTTYYTVIDYQPSDFTQLTGDAMVSETYYAVDSAGNVTKKRINVEIVDVDASIQDADPKDGESRFISYKYLWTLKETSIWLTEPYFSQLVSSMYYEEVDPEIKAAYPHIYNERTESLALQMIDVDMTPPIPIFGDMFKHEIRGTRQYDRPPLQVWIFKHEDVLAVKQFVEENGFTTYADKEELDAFLEKFDYCYKYDNGVFRHEGTKEEPDFYKRWFDKLAL